MDQHEIDKRAQEKATIAACDPLTVVDNARRNLYAKSGQGEADPWIEEVLSRFDRQARAALGSSTFVGVSSPGGS